jgi:hypothetical protein
MQHLKSIKVSVKSGQLQSLQRVRLSLWRIARARISFFLAKPQGQDNASGEHYRNEQVRGHSDVLQASAIGVKDVVDARKAVEDGRREGYWQCPRSQGNACNSRCPQRCIGKAKFAHDEQCI